MLYYFITLTECNIYIDIILLVDNFFVFSLSLLSSSASAPDPGVLQAADIIREAVGGAASSECRAGVSAGDV